MNGNNQKDRGGSRGAPGAPPPPQNWKKYDFLWRKNVILHTKYPKQISRLPPLGAIFFKSAP